ncbi:MAG TPA: hypothetical protein VHU84_10635 [Lacipirellulaceae bacterium]|nr:hypothetical protein [Lacipirellulaceae bacterium]
MKFSWRSIVALICILAGVGGLVENIKQGLPANPPPGYVIGLYLPATFLIVAGIVIVVWDLRRKKS